MKKNKMLTYALYAGAGYLAYKYLIEPSMTPAIAATPTTTAKQNGSGIVQDASGLGLVPPGYSGTFGPQWNRRWGGRRGGWGQRQIDGGGNYQPSSIFTEPGGLPTYND